MKVFYRFFTLILAVITLVTTPLLLSCNNYKGLSFTAFNTDVSISVVDKRDNINKEVETIILNMLVDIENNFSTDKKTSFVYKLNNEKANVDIPLNDSAYYLMQKCKNYYHSTEGKFNPAILPLLELYKLSSNTFDAKTENYTPPSKNEVSSLLSICDYNLISFDEENKSIKKLHDDVKLDFGGVVKGYAVDKIRDLLIIEGVEKGFINVGGSSIYVFDHKDGLSIRHPRKQGEMIIKIDGEELKNSEVSTSGDYVRYYLDKDGNRYQHVINGSTGSAINNGFSSVTIIASNLAPTEFKSALVTDILSTALLLCNKDEFISFVKELPLSVGVYAVYEKDKTILSNQDESTFTILDTDYTAKNV